MLDQKNDLEEIIVGMMNLKRGNREYWNKLSEMLKLNYKMLYKLIKVFKRNQIIMLKKRQLNKNNMNKLKRKTND